jgi:hypothetical protein
MGLHNLYLRILARSFAMMLVLWTSYVLDPAFAASSSMPTPAEQWILKKVAAGEDADLKENFPREADRAITASFLRKLLTHSGMTIKLPPYGVRIWNAVVKGNLNLTNEEIPSDTRLNDCIFEDDVILTGAHFKQNLHFYRTRFKGLVTLDYAIIDGDLEGKGAHFDNPKYEVNFESMKVAGPVLLGGTSFDGSARFFGMSAGGNLDLNEVHFNSNEQADFELIKVNGHAGFNGAVFNGPVRFYGANITNEFEASEARFNDKPTGANFEGMTVNSAASFNGAVFNGPVRFYRVNVTSVFDAHGAHFNDTLNWADFGQLTVNGSALFNGAVFEGPANFYRARIANIETSGTYFNRGVVFSGMRANSVGFLGAFFQGPIFLDDMTYEQISPSEDENLGAEKLLDMIHKSKSSVGAHATLEQYHRRRGDLGKADDVYIDQRRSETKKLSWGTKWLLGRMVDFLVGYGRKPWRVLIWSGIIVTFGWYVFRRRQSMQPQKAEYELRHYSAFLYSLDLFLPIVDIQAASVWMPKTERRFARLYLPVHVILGWILATFLVAALTGTLK